MYNNVTFYNILIKRRLISFLLKKKYIHDNNTIRLLSLGKKLLRFFKRNKVNKKQKLNKNFIFNKSKHNLTIKKNNILINNYKFFNYYKKKILLKKNNKYCGFFFKTLNIVNNKHLLQTNHLNTQINLKNIISVEKKVLNNFFYKRAKYHIVYFI